MTAAAITFHFTIDEKTRREEKYEFEDGIYETHNH
jgi:hypothetical protein